MRTTADPEVREVAVPAGKARLNGDLTLPADATGLVIFAHGSGSGRHSPRNRYVAGVLNSDAVATLLIDLLSEEEESLDRVSGQWRFDIELLTSRLIAVTGWAARQPALKDLGIGYFGASTGAAAALSAAAQRGDAVQAVVSRGGRPDLAGDDALAAVVAPCLFIVGGNDPVVLQLNREAMAQLPRSTVRHLEIVPDATHLFEEPGALVCVAALARKWFLNYLNTNR